MAVSIAQPRAFAATAAGLRGVTHRAPSSSVGRLNVVGREKPSATGVVTLSDAPRQLHRHRQQRHRRSSSVVVGAVAHFPAGGVRRRGASTIVRQASDAAAVVVEDEPPAASKEKNGASTVSQDILAGISTACVAMPQSCAYALLAGTGVKCAVMAAAAASVPCAILGSSRYMQVGCLSLAALLTRGTLTSLGLPAASAVYVMGASVLAFFAGLTRIALGFAKLGDFITSLPVALLQGFVSAATWMVFFSQVPAMVGARAVGPMAGNFATAAFWIVAHPLTWHLGTASLAALCFVVMLNGSKIHRMFPSALTCCILGCVMAVNGLDVGATVGAISVDVGTLFPPAALQIPRELVSKLVVPGMALGAITYLEGAAVMKMWADKDGEKWDSNKDLIAQGVANVCSAAVGGMTVAGVISRSSFGISAGAKTKLSHFVTGLVLIAFTVFGGGELLAVLPKAVLGALVGCGVLPLLGPTTKMQPLFNNFMAQPYEVKRDCFLCWATAWFTFTATPTLDIGLYKGCALALVFKLYELARGKDKADGTLHLVEGGPPPDEMKEDEGEKAD